MRSILHSARKLSWNCLSNPGRGEGLHFQRGTVRYSGHAKKDERTALLAAIIAIHHIQLSAPALCLGSTFTGSINDKVFDYLNVANQGSVRMLHPLTQKEQNSMFARSLINPAWYLKAAASAGANQWTDTLEEWKQGACPVTASVSGTAWGSVRYERR
jgi:hypothetical protein